MYHAWNHVANIWVEVVVGPEYIARNHRSIKVVILLKVSPRY